MFTARRQLRHGVQALRRVPFFADCTFTELARIDRLGTPVDVRSGRTLTREGEEGHECFVTVNGIVIAERSGQTIGAIGAASIAERWHCWITLVVTRQSLRVPRCD